MILDLEVQSKTVVDSGQGLKTQYLVVNCKSDADLIYM